MVMVSSARWPASSLILLSSTARSWLPGWYCLTGSLTGTGVLETASMLLMVWALLTRSYSVLLGLTRSYSVLLGQVGQFLGGVPAEFVALGAVHGEPGVLVAGVGGGQRFDRAAHVGVRVRGVHVRGGQVLELNGLAYGYPGGLAVAGIWFDVLGRDVGGQHHPPRRRGRVTGEQPQRGAGRLGQRGVLQFLGVAAGVRLAQRGRDREAGQRTGPDLAGQQGLRHGGQGRRQEDAHGVSPVSVIQIPAARAGPPGLRERPGSVIQYRPSERGPFGPVRAAGAGVRREPQRDLDDASITEARCRCEVSNHSGFF